MPVIATPEVRAAAFHRGYALARQAVRSAGYLWIREGRIESALTLSEAKAAATSALLSDPSYVAECSESENPGNDGNILAAVHAAGVSAYLDTVTFDSWANIAEYTGNMVVLS